MRIRLAYRIIPALSALCATLLLAALPLLQQVHLSQHDCGCCHSACRNQAPCNPHLRGYLKTSFAENSNSPEAEPYHNSHACPFCRMCAALAKGFSAAVSAPAATVAPACSAAAPFVRTVPVRVVLSSASPRAPPVA
jgi:hypothetical protein